MNATTTNVVSARDYNEAREGLQRALWSIDRRLYLSDQQMVDGTMRAFLTISGTSGMNPAEAAQFAGNIAVAATMIAVFEYNGYTVSYK